jgi:prolyl-tRNA synthetase
VRQSKLFTKIERSAPKDEVSLNAQLLTRGGFIYKNSAGVYSYLPLGWRVMQNISQIVRKEMNAIGGEEMFMPALVEKKYLDVTGRWNVGIGFRVYNNYDDNDNQKAKVKSHSQKSSFVLGWTHEEIIAEIATKYISSYKDLPFAAYQIQNKFRNEPRAKSGLLRGREFLMKDLYSFHSSQEDLMEYYEKVAEAYHKIFERCGLKSYYTLAAGGDFTVSNTHEFQVLAEVGEDTIYLCDPTNGGCEYAENKEISKLENGGKCPKCSGKIGEYKSIEVGNIFPLGTKYSEAFNLKFKDERGEEKHVVMGSYGIGLGRVMATVLETSNDDKGIIWPESIAPFKIHLLELSGASAEGVYKDLQKAGIQVLYDDRSASAGEKFAEADLIGIPYRAVVSPKTGDKVELKKRDNDTIDLISTNELINIIKK